jgi:hypothetical protein
VARSDCALLDNWYPPFRSTYPFSFAYRSAIVFVVSIEPVFFSFCYEAYKVKWIFLSFVFFLVASTAASCGKQQDELAHLRVADVPVRPLLHTSGDPTVTYQELSPLQIAVYWTDPSEGVLGVVHALRAMGIPFFVTRDFSRALRHRLVIIYPSSDSNTFTPAQIDELTRHVRSGGSLFAVNALSRNLGPLFGFSAVTPSRQRYQVSFSPGSDPALHYLNRPEELQVPLGATKYPEIFWTNGYLPDPSAAVLAHFEDGSAAVLRKSSGKGTAYLCGLSFHDVVLRNQVNRDFDAERHYVNAFEPGSDVWLLFLRAWYETAEPAAVRISTIPGGQMSVLLLSHDVDWEYSFAPALSFAGAESSFQTRSTFFIQAKYVSDANSHSFFFGNNLAILRRLSSSGNSVGSHSIIHSRGFNKFELGTGGEAFPAYQPRGTGFDSSTGATVFGEVRVSKQLLDGEIPGQQTDFFRAGHLRVPPTLPEALQRCGYLFDSSFTADDVLSNFPYALPLGLLFEEDSGLYEFPVTIDDSEDPPLSQRLDKALDVIRANAENGAPNVLLIHPTDSQAKVQAEQALLRGLPPGVTATDMESFARFWRARDRLRWTARTAPGQDSMELDVSSDEAIDGLTFEFQREIADLKGGAKLLPDHRRILLPLLESGQPIHVLVHFHPGQ